MLPEAKTGKVTRRGLNWLFVTVLILSVIVPGYLMCVANVGEWGAIPFSSFGTMAGASIAALGALAVAQTYSERKVAEVEQRSREAEQRYWEETQKIRARREDAYGALAHHYVAAFSSPGPLMDLSQLRANAALWASPDVLEVMGEWNRFASSLNSTQVQGGALTVWTVPSRRRADLEELVARMVRAMRRDLDMQVSKDPKSPRDASPEVIAGMIFNDYEESIQCRQA